MSDTDDITESLNFIKEKAGDADIVGVGLSMGANIMMRYAGLHEI
jgi:predicted alpha/beta-fold hydrolase